MTAIGLMVSQIKKVAASYLLSVSLVGAGLLGNGCAALVTDQQEIALGQKYKQEVSSQSDIVSDPYLTRLGQQLVAAAPPRSVIQYQFFVVQDDELNAFAIPGGSIYVNSGTIAACASSSELAAVLAHEIAHVALEHHKQSISSTMGIDLLNQLVLNQSKQVSQEMAKLVEQGVLLRFSRGQESEADAEAVVTLYRANYNPIGLISFFEKLVARYGSGSRFFEIMSSHPVTEDRIASVRNLISQLPLKATLVQDDPAFHSFKSRYVTSEISAAPRPAATESSTISERQESTVISPFPAATATYPGAIESHAGITATYPATAATYPDFSAGK